VRAFTDRSKGYFVRRYVVDSVVPRRQDHVAGVRIDVQQIRCGVPWSDAAMYKSSEPSLLKVSLVTEAPCLFLGLRGELDLCSATEVPRDEYSSRQDLTTVLVDLGELTFCDITGLRALLIFARNHQAQGRSVVIVRATPFMWRLLRLCGITDRLEFERPAIVAA
jgi:anti-sigma B factor antagonist